MASHLLRSVLSPAVRLWLQSQVESVVALDLTIESSDRQLLSGKIPQISIGAESVIYQELRLSHISLEGREIAVNLSQVVRGKPLRLLAPVVLEAEVILNEVDLNASLASALLAPVWLDWQRQLADRLRGAESWDGAWGLGVVWGQPEISIGCDALTLRCGVETGGGSDRAEAGALTFVLSAPVLVSDGQILTLVRPRWTIGAAAMDQVRGEFEDLVLDLGKTVTIESLQLQAQQLICRGQILVQP